jgi:hypothetical protein
MISYELTPELRERFPVESRRWQTLIQESRDPEYHGCLSCRFYSPIHNPEETNESEEVPWKSETAFVDCDYDSGTKTSLKINCHNWRHFR